MFSFLRGTQISCLIFEKCILRPFIFGIMQENAFFCIFPSISVFKNLIFSCKKKYGYKDSFRFYIDGFFKFFYFLKLLNSIFLGLIFWKNRNFYQTKINEHKLWFFERWNLKYFSLFYFICLFLKADFDFISNGSGIFLVLTI